MSTPRTRTRAARTTSAKPSPRAARSADAVKEQEPALTQLGEETSEALAQQPIGDAAKALQAIADESVSVPLPVPGGHGFELAAPVTFAGIEWTPADGDPFASPIGAALAAEMAGAA